jgi:hypothetical protein
MQTNGSKHFNEYVSNNYLVHQIDGTLTPFDWGEDLGDWGDARLKILPGRRTISVRQL